MSEQQTGSEQKTDEVPPVSVAQVMSRAAWQPLPGVTGRFMLADPRQSLSVRDLAGQAATLHVIDSETTDDRILVVPLDGGGLISTRRSDGHEVHTLNSDSEFRRRLLQLGIHPREYRRGLY